MHGVRKAVGWSGLLLGMGLAGSVMAAPQYVLQCVPVAGFGFGEWLQTRLAVAGWQQNAREPQVGLCFEVQKETVWNRTPYTGACGPSAAMSWGRGNGWWPGPGGVVALDCGWVPGQQPVLYLKTVPLPAGHPVSTYSTPVPAADNPQAGLERAASSLIDRLPWPQP
jgi:hypothetical protein